MKRQINLVSMEVSIQIVKYLGLHCPVLEVLRKFSVSSNQVQCNSAGIGFAENSKDISENSWLPHWLLRALSELGT